MSFQEDQALKSKLEEYAADHTAASFDELCSLAARLFNVEVAAVVLNQDGHSRLVAGHGLKIGIWSIK